MAAWSILNGPPGLEGIHHWTLGDNGLYLNNLDGSFGQEEWPRIVVEEITGLHSRPDVDDNRIDSTARIGERALPSLPRAKTVVYSGLIQALDRDDLRIMAAIMRAVFTDDATTEGTMTCYPHPTIGGTALHYVARCLQLDIDDQQQFDGTAVPSAWQREFTLGLRQSDPRYYASGDLSATDPAASGATVTVTNDGLAQSDPIIFGATAGGVTVTLENLSVPVAGGGHATLVFSDDLPQGNLTVNFYARPRTAILTPPVGDDIDATQFLTTYTWWDRGVPGLKPITTGSGDGDNSVKATGLSDWMVQWRSATW